MVQEVSPPAGKLALNVIDLTAPPLAAVRRLCLLSDGIYSVMLTDSGGGFSRWKGLEVTRWREDATRDNRGSHLLLRDEHSGVVWSATRQGLGTTAQDMAAPFTQGGAETS